MTVLQGPLADRDSWSARRQVPDREDDGGDRHQVRDADHARGVLRHHPVRRLRPPGRHHQGGHLGAAGRTGRAGLLARRPYREPGQRSRDEYVLTEAGTDFMPVVWAMFEWGRRHLPGRDRLRLTHQGCGAEAAVEIRCAEGHLVPPDELGMRLVKAPKG